MTRGHGPATRHQGQSSAPCCPSGRRKPRPHFKLPRPEIGEVPGLHLGTDRNRGCLWQVTLCDPMDCSRPGSSVHWILQPRKLEWVAVPSSRESSRPRDGIRVSYVSCIDRQVFTISATWEARRIRSSLKSENGRTR